VTGFGNLFFFFFCNSDGAVRFSRWVVLVVVVVVVVQQQKRAKERVDDRLNTLSFLKEEEKKTKKNLAYISSLTLTRLCAINLYFLANAENFALHVQKSLDYSILLNTHHQLKYLIPLFTFLIKVTNTCLLTGCKHRIKKFFFNIIV